MVKLSTSFKYRDVYKVVVFVPPAFAGKLRLVMGEVGAGKIGRYTNASFTLEGTGRFKPQGGSKPFTGTSGLLKTVDEERIEVIIERKKLDEVITAILEVHPYEQPAIDVFESRIVERI